MKFLNAQAPHLSLDDATTLARDLFGLNGRLSPLYSERDQNFRLTTAEGAEWVFKIANADEDAATLDCQLKALAHVAETAPALPVPRLCRTGSGETSAIVTGPDGRAHTVYAVSFLPGRIAADCTLADQDFQRIGAAIASLQRALSGFFHPALGGRQLLWDVREAPKLSGKVHHLGPLADEARAILDGFARDVAPRLAALRAQAIHGDVHGHNLILGEDNAITGIIDFGDMFHGPAILDLSDALSDFMADTSDPEAMWQALVRGFNAVQPVTPLEIDLLYDLMVMRRLITLLITAIRAAETPDQADYIATSGFGDPAALRAMLAIGRDRATALFAAAAGQAAPLARQPVAEMVVRRKKVMGSRLYVFYDPPLHMVRGEGVWLYDAEGRRYLDCYNNVPIIGHCNPRVTDAIA
ncbi:MAG: phosphotransferase, partial [Rhodobacteraceae bacterium]|nr:phosphotransferase [Paracoccaceae bacterium]